MLIFYQSEFEDLMSVLINTDNFNRSVFLYLCNKLKFRDEICYHFEVHDAEGKVDQIFEYVNINLVNSMLFEGKHGKQAGNNHQKL